MSKNKGKKIRVGKIAIGGGEPVRIQSMCNTDTRDVKSTVSQILELENEGVDIIRVAVPDMEAAAAVSEIKKTENLKIGVPAFIKISNYSQSQLARLMKKHL